MSVIVNMDAPKCCGECKAFVCYRTWGGDSGDWFCGITKSDVQDKELKNSDCPIIDELPKNHGRLIDIDKAIDDYWDGYSMTISNDTLDKIPVVVKQDDNAI